MTVVEKKPFRCFARSHPLSRARPALRLGDRAAHEARWVVAHSRELLVDALWGSCTTSGTEARLSALLVYTVATRRLATGASSRTLAKGLVAHPFRVMVGNA